MLVAAAAAAALIAAAAFRRGGRIPFAPWLELLASPCRRVRCWNRAENRDDRAIALVGDRA